MPDLNYVIDVCFSSIKTPGVITLQELHTGRKTLLQLLLRIDDRWYMTIWNGKLTTELCILIESSS